MSLSDSELLRKLQKGDSSAFALLVEQYKGMVLNLVSRMMGNNNPAAEDLSQEVFVRVWKGVPTFRGDCKLSTWIYRITINLCIAESKTARGRALFLPIDEPGLASQPQMQIDSDNPYGEEVILKDKMMYLLPQMPEKYRIAISLYYLKDLSYLEIGEIMDVPMGTVKSYLFRGKAWLRERLIGQAAPEDLP